MLFGQTRLPRYKNQQKSTRSSFPLSNRKMTSTSNVAGLMPLIAWAILLSFIAVPTYAAQYDFIHCDEKCNESLCPQLSYCEGVAIKDSCNCCLVCSDTKYQPHALTLSVPPKGGEACKQVKCPKFKICSENMQGLPLCKCPSTYFCRSKKKREICATNGETYPSRCHMRVASCNLGSAVRKKYRGACSPEKDRKVRRRKMKGERRRRRGDDKDIIHDAGRADKKKRGRKNGDKEKGKKKRNRKRRKIGIRGSRDKRRTRRHRKLHHVQDDAGRAFEEAFAHYTWSKK